MILTLQNCQREGTKRIFNSFSRWQVPRALRSTPAMVSIWQLVCICKCPAARRQSDYWWQRQKQLEEGKEKIVLSTLPWGSLIRVGHFLPRVLLLSNWCPRWSQDQGTVNAFVLVLYISTQVGRNKTSIHLKDTPNLILYTELRERLPGIPGSGWWAGQQRQQKDLSMLRGVEWWSFDYNWQKLTRAGALVMWSVQGEAQEESVLEQG